MLRQTEKILTFTHTKKEKRSLKTKKIPIKELACSFLLKYCVLISISIFPNYYLGFIFIDAVVDMNQLVLSLVVTDWKVQVFEMLVNLFS